MEKTKEWEDRIIEVLKTQYKKYLKAVDNLDGYEECKAIGATVRS